MGARILLTLLALGLLLGACGNLPQPFRGGPRAITDDPLLDMPTAVGIAVVPVAGLSEPLNGRLTKAVATGLQAFEIPAEAVSANTGLGFTLQATASAEEQPGGDRHLRIDWSLRSRTGRIAGSYVQQALVSASDWTSGNEATASRLAAEAAEAIAATIDGGGNIASNSSGAAAAPKPPPLPSVSVKSVEGAPGDGRESLKLAVIQGLAESGVRRDDVNPDVVLTCHMTSTHRGVSQQDVEIIWKATLRDGRELGEVKLENTIPAGSLEGAWGPTAFSIAGAALENLMRLLVQVPQT